VNNFVLEVTAQKKTLRFGIFDFILVQESMFTIIQTKLSKKGTEQEKGSKK
jgi:hypothetical protein